MSRPLRIEYENACYHVMNRGRGHQDIFHGEAYFDAFLKCLSEAHTRFGLEILAYCLMSNHYHLLLKTPRANLGRIMRHVDGLYTQRHNRLRQTDGSLFRGRYKALLVDAGSYLLQVSTYVHRNPIETKRPIVQALEDYRWSSYPAYINKAHPIEGLNRELVYAELGHRQRFRAYRRYVMVGNDENIQDFYSKKKLPAVFGSQIFADTIKGKVQALDREIDRKGLDHPIAMKTIRQAVALYYGITELELVTTKRGKGRKNIPRWVAMKLCQDLGGARLGEIAGDFNVGHYSTVSQTIGRLNRLMVENRTINKDYKVLSQDLTL
jgi:REP element-mobilizing transposase RayT